MAKRRKAKAPIGGSLAECRAQVKKRPKKWKPKGLSVYWRTHKGWYLNKYTNESNVFARYAQKDFYRSSSTTIKRYLDVARGIRRDLPTAPPYPAGPPRLDALPTEIRAMIVEYTLHSSHDNYEDEEDALSNAPTLRAHLRSNTWISGLIRIPRFTELVYEVLNGLSGRPAFVPKKPTIFASIAPIPPNQSTNAGRRADILRHPPRAFYYMAKIPTGLWGPNVPVVVTTATGQSLLPPPVGINDHIFQGWHRGLGRRLLDLGALSIDSDRRLFTHILRTPRNNTALLGAPSVPFFDTLQHLRIVFEDEFPDTRMIADGSMPNRDENATRFIRSFVTQAMLGLRDHTPQPPAMHSIPQLEHLKIVMKIRDENNIARILDTEQLRQLREYFYTLVVRRCEIAADQIRFYRALVRVDLDILCNGHRRSWIWIRPRPVPNAAGNYTAGLAFSTRTVRP